MTCDVFDVVVVPFPFTDSLAAVRRPALVLSRPSFNRHGHTVLAMITDSRNAPWPLDTGIDASAAGLKMASVVRMKLFTLDSRLLIGKVGRLKPADRRKVSAALATVMPVAPPHTGI
ncbi:MAG TPA: type II toxin-antitoxin system PemK/MazF family toxin [Bryobacteraceae bacterium]|jgi:mRNA interferase MazF